MNWFGFLVSVTLATFLLMVTMTSAEGGPQGDMMGGNGGSLGGPGSQQKGDTQSGGGMPGHAGGSETQSGRGGPGGGH